MGDITAISITKGGKIEKRHTCRLPFKRNFQSRRARDEQPHGHWFAQKKRLWGYHGWKVWKLPYAVAKNDIDVLPWYLGVQFTDQEGKNTSVPVGRSAKLHTATSMLLWRRTQKLKLLTMIGSVRRLFRR